MVLIQTANEPRAMPLLAMLENEILLEMKAAAIPIPRGRSIEDLRRLTGVGFEYSPRAGVPREEFLGFEDRPLVLECGERFAGAALEGKEHYRANEKTMQTLTAET